MEKLERNPLGLSRAGIVMLAWGVLILVAALYNQWWFPGFDSMLLIWAGVTVVGLAVQAVCEVRDQPINFLAWVAVVVVGWAFTLYAIYSDPSLARFSLLSAIWLIMLGIAYMPTAIQIDSRYWWFAAAHLVVGGLMELSALRVVAIPFLNNNASLLLGIIGGGSLIAAAYFGRVPKTKTVAASQQVESGSASI